VRRFAVAALALLLGACAAVGPREAANPAAGSVLAAPFDIDGRLSARRGSEGGAAGFSWVHRGASDEIDLVTPLGQTLARLTGDAAGARAQWPDGRTVEARDFDALTERILGVGVPVQGLVAWLRGLARPGSPASVERDAQGRPSLLRQDGWEIAYRYADSAAARANALDLRYADAEATSVRILIDRWQ